MIAIVNFRAEHLLDFMPVDKSIARMAVEVEKGPGPAYSALRDGRCIGAGGALYKRGKTWLVWLTITPELQQFPIFFHRTCRRLFQTFLANTDWGRIEAQVAANMETHCAWIKTLGFVAPAEPEYGSGPNGEDMFLYYRLKNGIPFSNR